MPVPGTMTAADVFAPTWQWDMANAEYDVLRIALDTASGGSDSSSKAWLMHVPLLDLSQQLAKICMLVLGLLSDVT